MLRYLKFMLAALGFTSVCALTSEVRANVDPDSHADNYADVWLRLDADRVGAQAWVGGTKSWSGFDLAGNLVLVQNYPGVVDPLQNAEFEQKVGDDYRAPTLRLELGPAISTGGFFFLPKVGIGFDFERKQVAPFVPQLMTIIQGGPLYVESWVQFFFYSWFDTGSQDSFYTRDMILIALSNAWSVGPAVELTVAIKNGSGNAVRSLPIGATVNVSPIEQLTFGLFAGYETKKSARNSEHDFVSARLTATYLFW